MIELVLEENCTSCGTCVELCPTDVFEFGAGNVPVIARQADCQTCYLCEAHCPSDALYVGPLRYPSPVDRAEVIASATLGNIRRAWGFDRNEIGTVDYTEGQYGRLEAPSRLKANKAFDPNAKIYEALKEAERRSLVSTIEPAS
jgi:NAD-dependent dihydropyrimidine dehydrogenase PreA subunit